MSVTDGIDVERARRETPGCEKVLHFNNAGAALMPQVVIDAQIEHLKRESEIGGYEAHDEQIGALDDFYHAAADLLGCGPDELAFVENATRAWDMAFYSVPFQRGDRILTGRSEYASNYIAFLQICRKTGAHVEVVPSEPGGEISIAALKNIINDRVKLIAITHVPTNSGLVNDAVAVGRVAREAGILYLVDACQSVGQMPIDVQEIGCDFLSATGRKFLRGPRGTGMLYVKRNVVDKLEPPFLDLHAAEWISPAEYRVRDDARRFENWEQNYAGKRGLAIAIRYAMQFELRSIERRVTHLADMLRSGLSALPQVQIQDPGTRRCGIVTFTVGSVEAEQVKQRLKADGINVTVSTSSSTLLDMSARNLTEVVRASVHYYNTEDEVDRFCKAVASIAGA